MLNHRNVLNGVTAARRTSCDCEMTMSSLSVSLAGADDEPISTPSTLYGTAAATIITSEWVAIITTHLRRCPFHDLSCPLHTAGRGSH